MKIVVLGIMIASVSAAFAQADQTSTHQLKNRFTAKQQMHANPAVMEVSQNGEDLSQSDFVVLSRKEVKSDVATGTIRVKNGTPFIDLNNGREERRMMPVNLPKAMAVDGQVIQFRYTVSDAPLPRNGKCSMTINVYEISMSPKK